VRIVDVQGIMVAVFTDWRGTLANPRFIRVDDQIIWSGYAPERLPDRLTVGMVEALVEAGQYTFQVLEDGALIQMMYEYDRDGERLLKARLAYYGTSSPTSEEMRIIGLDQAEEAPDEPEETETETDSQAPSAEDDTVRWLRIDYDPRAARGPIHCDCHMHLSGFPTARFIVRGVPTPSQFVEFVMMLCYPDTYARHHLDGAGAYIDPARPGRINRVTVACAPSGMLDSMTHLRVPSL
jgi:hypothetical protein